MYMMQTYVFCKYYFLVLYVFVSIMNLCSWRALWPWKFLNVYTVKMKTKLNSNNINNGVYSYIFIHTKMHSNTKRTHDEQRTHTYICVYIFANFIVIVVLVFICTYFTPF